MQIKLKTFKQRRKNLANLIKGGIAIIRSGSEKTRSNDTFYPYRSNSYFEYFSGFPEPDSILVIMAKPLKSIIFSKTKNPEKEIWDGYIYGPEKACIDFNLDEGLPIQEFDKFLKDILITEENIYLLDEDVELRSKLSHIALSIKGSARSRLQKKNQISSLNYYADQLRIIKSKEEIDCIRKACSISSSAHRYVMENIHNDSNEFQIDARLNFIFSMQGAQAEAYKSIVASGSNACTLHYIKNNSKLNKGDLVLIDAGCEYNHYASDITRTFPIDGSFSAPQRDVYEIVLAAQKKAIDQVKKNNRFDDPHKSAVEVLSQGLIDLKVLKKSISEIVEKKLYAKFFMHRTSHWMGMDVHDVGNYFTANSGSAVLSDGQVLTIEPGLYFADNASVPKAFRGIGIRIEDDVLVSGKEAEILTSDCPKEISALESIIGKS